MSEKQLRLFASYCRLERARRDYSEAEVAHAVGLSSHGRISEIENEKWWPPLDIALKLSAFFGVPLPVMLGHEVATPPLANPTTPPDPIFLQISCVKVGHSILPHQQHRIISEVFDTLAREFRRLTHDEQDEVMNLEDLGTERPSRQTREASNGRG